MPIRYLLFDVDDTLYPASTGVWPLIRERIALYLEQRLHLPPAEAEAKRMYYFETYGTTLSGLLHEHPVDAADFLAFVHDLPIHTLVQPNPALDAMLHRLPQIKAVFTNSDAAHTARVLQRLGVAQHFGPIIDIQALHYQNKPDPRAYAAALQLLGAAPAECLMADDQVRNLRPARAAGMFTVLVNPEAEPTNEVDAHIGAIEELERVL